MISGKLYKQYPKQAKDGVAGVMTYHDNKRMLWLDKYEDGARILCELRNPELVNVSSRGLEVRGWEPSGTDKFGCEVLKYQEWWVTK